VLILYSEDRFRHASITPEPPGPNNCEFGDIKVNSGLDDNGCPIPNTITPDGSDWTSDFVVSRDYGKTYTDLPPYNRSRS